MRTDTSSEEAEEAEEARFVRIPTSWPEEAEAGAGNDTSEEAEAGAVPHTLERSTPPARPEGPEILRRREPAVPDETADTIRTNGPDDTASHEPAAPDEPGERPEAPGASVVADTVRTTLPETAEPEDIPYEKTARPLPGPEETTRRG